MSTWKRNMMLVMFLMSVLTLFSLMMQTNRLSILQKGYATEKQRMTLTPDRWIVTSSLQENGVIEIPGWIILLYGPGKHEICRYPACVTLGDWHPYPVLENSGHHFKPNDNRKISAYLFAISQGAIFICSVDSLHCGTEDILSRFIYEGKTTGVVPVTNASYVHPGTLFVRGISDMESSDHLLIKPHDMFYRYVIKENVSPAIQVITELGGNTYYSDIFEQLPPVFLPLNTFTSLEPEVVLFRYDAFWALVMMELGNESGLLLMQKLIWVHGASVGVYPVSVQDNRPVRKYANSAEIANNEALKKWYCQNKRTFDCIILFMRFCRVQNFLLEDEVNMFSLFIQELGNLGYSFPKRSENEDIVHPTKHTFGLIKLPTNSFPESSTATKALDNYCPQAHVDFSVKCNTDIGLIITFNTVKLYRNIPILEAMYRPYFKHILYCGPNITEFQTYAHNSSIGYYIFIEAFKQKWLFMYDCTAEALKLNLKVEGFLQIGDDTILNAWNTYDLPRNKIWLHTGMKIRPVSLQKVDWAFWVSGRRRILKLFNEMQSTSLFNNTSTLKRYVTNFRRNSINYKLMFTSGCDFMYMPTRLKEDFIFISDIFTQHGIMLETGYANMVMCLDRRKDIHFVQDGSLWRSNRTKWASIYSKDLIFMHPFKIGLFLKEEVGLKLFCQDFFNSPYPLHSS